MKKPIIYKTRPAVKVTPPMGSISKDNPLRKGDRVRAVGGDIGTVVYVDSHDSFRTEYAVVDWDSLYDYETMYETQTGLHFYRTNNAKYYSLTRVS